MRVVRVGDVATVIMGQAPPGESYNDAGSGLPLVAGASDLGELTPEPSRFTTSPSKTSESGDIILCVRATIGDLNWSDKKYCLGRGVAGLRPAKGKLKAEYLWHYLAANANNLAALGRGATFKQITRTDIEAFEIPLPAIAAQQRIAAILDQTDELRRLRQKSIERLNELGQSIFDELTRKSLVDDWEYKRLTDFFEFRTGKLDSNAAVPGGRYPFFTCSREDFAIDTYAFDCEALLLAGNNANADYSVKHYKGKFNAYQRTYVLRLKDPRGSYAYAKVALQRKLSELKQHSKGSNTKYLTMGVFGELQILVPPHEVQDTFSEQMAALAPLQRRVERATAEINRLFASLQQRAFAGDL